MEAFMSSRAQGLVPGGLIVILILGLPDGVLHAHTTLGMGSTKREQEEMVALASTEAFPMNGDGSYSYNRNSSFQRGEGRSEETLDCVRLLGTVDSGVYDGVY
ncbi:hypothetical protein RJ639_010359 [Escallonia herrerae]|uniref:Uncharacterized protein n=1 Tax=Escallonia herrerae TaxID=1293975 RepID=A0AA89AUR3_9ASTE|nr:hypothetical protein RJ639_010359 [Escallonia herrerae]